MRGIAPVGFRFQLANQIKCVATPTALSIGSDDQTVAAVCDRQLVRMDLVEGTSFVLSALPGTASRLSVNTTKRLIGVATGVNATVYDLSSGDLVRAMSREGAPGFLKAVPVKDIAVAADGEMLVTTTTGSRIFISNVKTGQWEHIMFVKYDGCDVAISPNGKLVAIFGAPKASELSGHVTMFLVRRGLQPMWTAWHESKDAISSARFSPDSKTLISCGAGDGARVWDAQSGELEWHCEIDDVKLRAAWSFGQGDLLATLGAELMITRRGSDDPVFREEMQASSSAFAISPSGKVLIRVEDNNMLSVWKLAGPK